MKKNGTHTKTKKRPTKNRLRTAAIELCRLVGSTIEALEYYDSVTAEYRRITQTFETVLFSKDGVARRRAERRAGTT